MRTQRNGEGRFCQLSQSIAKLLPVNTLKTMEIVLSTPLIVVNVCGCCDPGIPAGEQRRDARNAALDCACVRYCTCRLRSPHT
jgi:hypothetical protein